jgi:predicted HAD superfamily Cof-like phosphohydrolase
MANKPVQSTFDEEIKLFNAMYLLPTLSSPGIPFVGDSTASARQKLMARLEDFKSILREELDEVDEILSMIAVGDPPEEILVALADWLGDMQVYCASEMRKFGLDNSVILSIIMASNRSKLGRDGKPLYDERNKVMKGPDFFPPEPEIRRYIAAAVRQANRVKQTD